jgi:hypothetical protein
MQPPLGCPANILGESLYLVPGVGIFASPITELGDEFVSAFATVEAPGQPAESAR